MQKIFVGDVQGCADELDVLIDRARAEFGDAFELWVVGDLVNRGPGNLRALERVRSLVEAGRGQFVLGNHEIFLISAALGVRALRAGDSIADVLESRDVDDWVDWLRARPLVATGQLAGQPFAMVHAASHPAWPLETLAAKGTAVSARLAASRADARDFLAEAVAAGSERDDLGRMTRCRSITGDGDWSSEEPMTPDRAWHAAWAKHGHDYGIVYGHWARQGLHVAQGLRGLDTGCVHHGRGRDGYLTAWLPEATSDGERGRGRRAFDLPDDRFWQIPAARRYYKLEESHDEREAGAG